VWSYAQFPGWASGIGNRLHAVSFSELIRPAGWISLARAPVQSIAGYPPFSDPVSSFVSGASRQSHELGGCELNRRVKTSMARSEKVGVAL
jgi:hypothetical protein